MRDALTSAARLEMTAEERNLHRRVSRVLADVLEQRHPEYPGIVRLAYAMQAAWELMLKVKWAGTLTTLENNLARLESRDWQI